MTIDNSLFLLSKRKLYLFIVTSAVSIITAIRFFGLDRDYFSYQRFYEKISIGGYSSRFEPGFELVANLFKLFIGTNSFEFFLFFIAFVSLYLKFSILSNIRHYSLLILIYFMLILPLHEMMQIRVSLALAVVYWALYKSTNSDITLLKKAILVGVGISFHYSAIILAPFILLPNIFNKRSKFLVILTSITPLVLINSSMDIVIEFAPMVGHYIQQANLVDEYINPFSSRNLIFLTILVIGLLNFQHIPREKLPWFYASTLGIGLWYGFMWLPVFAHRFLEITVFSYLVWVPSLPKISRIISLGLLFVLAVYFLIRALFISPFFS
jgi:hypothetical protein